MMDFSDIPQSTLLARGEYSTVRAAHEDCKKELSMLCGEVSALSSKVLRRLQPGNDAVPESVDELLRAARATLDKIEACADRIVALAAQRAELSPVAWGRG